MNWQEHIWVDADRMSGTPCFRGTRIPVHVVLDNLAAGVGEAELLASYSSLTAEHVRAALAFAADLAHDRILPIPA